LGKERRKDRTLQLKYWIIQYSEKRIISRRDRNEDRDQERNDNRERRKGRMRETESGTRCRVRGTMDWLSDRPGPSASLFIYIRMQAGLKGGERGGG